LWEGGSGRGFGCDCLSWDASKFEGSLRDGVFPFMALMGLAWREYIDG
jgi:hypothetical protein